MTRTGVWDGKAARGGVEIRCWVGRAGGWGLGPGDKGLGKRAVGGLGGVGGPVEAGVGSGPGEEASQEGGGGGGGPR